MKTKMFLTVLAVAVLPGLAGSALAQNTSTAPAPLIITGTSVNSAPPPAPGATAQPLPYGVSEILRLHRAQVGDDTIIAYIRNSGQGFALNADLIIYLQQQGLSSAVLNAMLSQPLTGGTASAYVPPTPTTAPPALDDSNVDSTPYYTPYYDYDDYPYYTDYGYYPGPYVVGGAWYGGGYYWGRGGHGGWNGGSGWHGGGTGGWHPSSAAVVHSSGGGGWHGGGGGGFHGGGGGFHGGGGGRR